MKKLIILILAGLFTCSLFIDTKHFTLRTYFDNGILYTYTTYPINDTSIQLIDNYMSISTEGATSKNTIGECIYFDHLEINSALVSLQAKVKFTEYLEDQQLTIIYAYSKLIPRYQNINNCKVNLQISTSNEYSAIGWPVIYGGF